ncbi:type-II calcium-dependent NADH dehydrogenase [Haematococcus lacustris]
MMLKHTGAPVTHKRRAAERLGQENVMWRPQFAPQRSCNKRKADRVALISNVASPERLMPSTEGVHSSPQLRPKKQDKPRVVVLGSGWGSVSFIKSLPPQISEQYDVVLVSPRNFFLYTPLLPAVATGTMEERSIVEPVRNFVQGKAEFYQALAKDVDPVAKELVCCFPDDNGFPEACFKISYDVLVVSVGSVNNTFGIKGVESHCNFFKSIEDAKMLRNRVSECFERAALPVTSPEERQRLLSFVVVGGGPTGVEVAAELYDMIHDDLRKLYPSLIEDVQIRIIELMDHVLSTYDRAISIYTAEQFKRTGVQLVLNSRVASVGDGVVNVVDKANQVTEIKFGACVWATGVAMNPLVKQLQQKLEGQSHFRSIMTDEYLRVNGSGGSIWAIGDAATIDQPKALDFADSLFQQADLNHDERLSLSELRSLLSTASTQFSHLAEHASFLETKAGSSRWGGLVAKAVQGNASPLAELPESTELSREQFKELVKKIDSGLRALPATAQVAKQQGEYLATVFARNRITGDPATSVMSSSQGPFKYSHKGSAAYVGRDKAVFDVPQLGPLTGFTAGLIWKSFETYSQFSFRNQCLVASDWVRTKLFGRDISRV